ncbi:hypothetical protein EOD40_15100 [Flavobacterium sufflavum]|uniref:LURP-one-related family protein n=1 Tax=Flavobacterium sufflavum TaxID=1921138 RepID=A0A437KMW3_9FLAO|nr:hypothetical protein [Flavobacterium sufflavum]RVT72737.1 hypothetical protein EOD40_15100 [Flavobacterium sufflavum]
MEAKSIDKKTFQLIENEQLLGELVYADLFYSKAEIKLPNSETYQIKPIGIFRTTTVVTKKGAEIANLKMNWRGQMLIAFQDGQEYVLKGKGMFYSKYVIVNKEQEILIEFDPKFNWKKFRYNYNITYNKIPEDILLILLGIYTSNYIINATSATM